MRGASRKPIVAFAIAFILFLVLLHPIASRATDQVSIPTGGAPDGVALDTTNGDLYVANSFDYVTVINPSTGTALQNISIPSAARGLLAFPTSIAFDNTTDRIFVADLALPGLWIIDAQTNKVVGNITLSFKLEHASPLPGQVICVNGRVFLTDTSLGMVYVFDARTGASLANISIGNYPQRMTYDEDNGYLYVALGASNVTTVVNTSTYTVVANITVPDSPYAVAYGGGDIYVTEADSNKVAVINGSTNTVTGDITVSKDPLAVVYTPDPHLFVFGGEVDRVSVIGVGESSGSQTLPYEFPSGLQYMIYDGAVGWLCGTFQSGGATNGLDCLADPLALATTSTSSTTSSESTTSTSSSSTTTTTVTGVDIPLAWVAAGATAAVVVLIGVLLDLRGRKRPYRV